MGDHSVLNTHQVEQRKDGAAEYSQGSAYVDGQIVPISEAKISMLDWGFLHSDATYDVVHVWQGRFFRLDEHLARFSRGMNRLRLSIPLSSHEISDILSQCVRVTRLKDAYVEMICTRGVPPAGSRDPRQCKNKFYAFVVPFVWISSPEQRERGLSMRVSKVNRISPKSVDPRIKNYHWLDLVNGLFEAFDAGDETVVLTDSSGNVVEGPGFNVFARIGESLVTPSSGVLEGITRQTAIDIAKKLDVNVEMKDLPARQLHEATEIFVTSTAGGIMHVSKIDGRKVGNGALGDLTAKMQRIYWELHSDPLFSKEV